jgi:uncharacterized protein YcbK (DUF882 family)
MNLIVFNRRDMTIPLSANFSTKEFLCSCGVCSPHRLDPDLIKRLQRVRDALNMSITVTSGFRCAKRQAQLRKGGLQTAAGTSTHEMGAAADITCSDMDALLVACEKEFKSIGVANTFLHVDTRVDKVRRWKYV